MPSRNIVYSGTATAFALSVLLAISAPKDSKTDQHAKSRKTANGVLDLLLILGLCVCVYDAYIPTLSGVEVEGLDTKLNEFHAPPPSPSS